MSRPSMKSLKREVRRGQVIRTLSYPITSRGSSLGIVVKLSTCLGVSILNT